MTQLSATAAPLRPGRIWYLVALAALVLGLVGAIYFGSHMAREVAAFPDSLQRVQVPGEAQLTLPRPGRYTVYHEFISPLQPAGQNTRDAELLGLSSSLTRIDGVTVALQLAQRNESFAMGRSAGFSLYNFTLEQPGDYVFRADYPGGGGPAVVLAVGHEMIDSFARIGQPLFGALLSAFTGVMTACVLAFVVWVRRQIALRKRQGRM